MMERVASGNTGGADEYHGLNPIRLLCGHVKQRFRAHAHADRFDPVYPEGVEEGEHVTCELPERDHPGGFVERPCPRKSGTIS